MDDFSDDDFTEDELWEYNARAAELSYDIVKKYYDAEGFELDDVGLRIVPEDAESESPGYNPDDPNDNIYDHPELSSGW
jgi:hypothetical protein